MGRKTSTELKNITIMNFLQWKSENALVVWFKILEKSRNNNKIEEMIENISRGSNFC